MRFDARGIIISESDLGTILEKGSDYAQNPDFMETAIKIARQSIGERSGELEEILDQPFGKGLLEKLGRLDEATEDELSRMLHMLDSKKEIIIPYAYILEIKSYVKQRIAMLLAADPTYENEKELLEYEHRLRHIENYLEY